MEGSGGCRLLCARVAQAEKGQGNDGRGKIELNFCRGGQAKTASYFFICKLCAYGNIFSILYLMALVQFF